MKVNNAPAMDSARMIADPFVYLGPSVLGNRYPDPMLSGQADIGPNNHEAYETA